MTIISNRATPGGGSSRTLIGGTSVAVAGSFSCRYAYRTGRRGPETKGASSATRGRFLLPAVFPMAAGSGTPSGVPVSFGPVREPAVIRHPIVFAGEVADSSTPKESEMSNDTSKPENRPNNIHFPLAPFGTIDPGRGYTGFGLLRTIFALDTTVAIDETTSGPKIRYRTDRKGLLALLNECANAQEALTDAMKSVGMLAVYANKDHVDPVDISRTGWLVTGLAELKADVDAAAALAAHALAEGGYLPDGGRAGQEGDDATP